MTKQSDFVALKAFRFGTEVLQPGDAVPLEAGRDYRLMLRLGQIAPVGSVTLAAGGQQQETELSTFQKGEPVVVVYDNGTYDRAIFVDFAEADDAAREALSLKEGDLTATVTLDSDDDGPLTVPLASVLPLHPVGKLLDLFEARAQSSHEREQEAAQASEARVREAADLQMRVDFLELLVKAIGTEGDQLADDFPVVKELRANHITTMAGLKLLADGEQGKAHLMQLDGIGESRAEKILEALTPEGG